MAPSIKAAAGSLLGGAILLSAALPAAAQLSVTAVAGIAGVPAPGWTPVRFNIENGGAPRRLTILATRAAGAGEAVERQRLSLNPVPASAKQQRWIYLPPNQISAGRPVNIEMQIEGQPAQQIVLNPEVLEDRPAPLLEVSPLQLIRGQAENSGRVQEPAPAVRHISPELLPDRAEGLSGWALIIIHDTPSRIWNDAQRQALYDYVLRGGCIILHPSNDPAALRSEFYQDLARATPNGVSRLPQPVALRLPGRFGAATLPAASAVADLQLLPGAAAMPGAARPVLTVRRIGLGAVYMAAWSVRDAADPAAGLARVWLSLTPPDQMNSGFDISPLQKALASRQPAPWVVGVFVLVYLVILAPLHYLIWKRLGRPALVWATFPAAVALLAVAAAVAPARGGAAMTGLVQISQTVLTIGESAGVTQAILAAPRPVTVGRISESSHFRGIPQPARPEHVGRVLTTDWSDLVELERTYVSTGDDSMIQAYGITEWKGAIQVRPLPDGSLEIDNRSGYELLDVRLLPNMQLGIGAVTAGRRIYRPAPLPGGSGAASEPSRGVRDAVIRGIETWPGMGDPKLRLAGWLPASAAPLQTSGGGAANQLHLLVLRAPDPRAAAAGEGPSPEGAR